MENSDEILVNRAQAGDAVAFGQLLERHYDMILRLGYRMLGSQPLAEDLAQEICCALPQKLGSFRGDAKFTTWLYRVTINAAKDFLRKQKTRHAAQEGWGDMFVMQQLDADEKAQDRAWLAQAMKTLPEDLREVLVLTLSENLSHAQAGDVLGVPPGTISWRISEAKKYLRAMAQSEETYP